MRFFISHRLPGGFRGGVVFGGGRRPARVARRRTRTRVRTRYIRTGPTIIVHMTAAEYAEQQARREKAQGQGCAALVAVALVVLAVSFWYISLPVLVSCAVIAGVVKSRGHAAGGGRVASVLRRFHR